MNFELTEEQKLLQDMIRDFARNEVAPVAKALEEKAEFPVELLSKMAGLGVLGMSIPPEYEGTRTDSLSLMLAIEEISRFLPSLAVILGVHCSLFCFSIREFGTEDQKRRYLPRAARGEVLGAFGLTEPGSGSDALSLRARARLEGDHYILEGTKNWITSGNNAQAYILFAGTGSSAEAKNTVSAFIVDKESPGLRVSKIEKKMGLHASLTAEIILENCRIPAENLLGKEGWGATIAFRSLDASRVGIAAQSVGISQRALDEAVRYAKQREAFGRPIAEMQAIQFMIADMALMTETARLLTYRAADLMDLNKPFTKESSMAKLFSSEAANKVVDMALQIHGGYGYSSEFFIEQLYRDARVLTIYEGTSEIQRLVISRNLLQ